jgi:NTP pyrophosphatase (non-canonical NTP hydrolase)
MNIKESQEKIEKFDKDRGWSGDWHLKDLSLNLVEETGELWNLIKWVEEEKQREIIKNKKEEASDYIGDSLFLLLKMANKMDVDASQALDNTLAEYEKRMPADKMKEVGHANKEAGGHDNKEA